MMGSIREKTVSFLVIFEVVVALQSGVGPTILAKGLRGQVGPGEKLSYSAPSDAGGVEVRNQRGQVQQAATQRARRAVAETQAPAVEPARGAFGQRTDGGDAQPQNRAERRAQDRKGR